MHVAGWQKLLSTGGDPPFPSSGLTLRAVPVSAGVVGDGPMPAAGAPIEMPAHGGGATARKGQQHLEVPPAEPVAGLVAERPPPPAGRGGPPPAAAGPRSC